MQVLFNWLCLGITSSFYLGLIPGKKGAGGGLIGSIVGLALLFYFFFISSNPLGLVLWGIAITFILGLLCINPAEIYIYQKYGKRQNHEKEYVKSDYNHTNIDEVHGQFLAGLPVFIIPFESTFLNCLFLLLSCVIFRIFDTKKYGVIKKAERRWGEKEGEKTGEELRKEKRWLPFGIMIDDTLGGLFTAILILVAMLITSIFI